ncbi:MAG: selenide, water dikinase SelD [Pseudomonadota bacterium]
MQAAQNIPIIKDLVLIGGGHSHVAVLKKFGMNPMPGLQITLITRDVHTPYSGMLPGYIAGHYRYDESHIDLRPLAKFCGARLIHAPATFLQLEDKQVICGERPAIHYDVLSINTGSTPSHIEVPGAKENTLAVKPINEFLQGWDQLMQRAVQRKGDFKVVVVGAGAGGVEVALATQFHLQQLLHEKSLSAGKLKFGIITGNTPVLSTHNKSIQKRFRRVLAEREVTIHKGIKAKRVSENVIELDNGETLETDAIIWATHASAPAWFKESGLAVDERGFIAVDDSLQSTSHQHVFAAGDVATVIDYPRPKSGVFAVRQGPPLYKNIRRALKDKKLKKHVPQISFLSLISTGDKCAIGSRGIFTFEGAWIWKLKDYIDREFMNKYNRLPEMQADIEPIQSELSNAEALKEISTIAMRCGGCGAKVGSNVLSRVVNQLTTVKRDDVILGLDAPDDAAVLEVPPGKVQVQSVDYFRSFIDDPYVFGQIAANHSLGDVFAMGAEAQAAMAIATVPYGREQIVEQQLQQMMQGALQVLNHHNAALIGGHSSEGAELSFGLSVTGIIEKQKLLSKGGMQAGDAIIITKPVGTGTLFAADMRGKAKGRWVTEAIESMIHSNHMAAQCLYKYDVHACTDVTGFGVLGHLVEMVKAGQIDIRVDINSLPVLSGALDTIQLGILSSLQASNVRLRRAIKNPEAAIKHDLYPLLFDPQTAGGLLASIPSENQDACVKELHELGYPHACVIGKVEAQSDSLESIRIQSN